MVGGSGAAAVFRAAKIEFPTGKEDDLLLLNFFW